jgi:hypothetical protein
MRTSILIAATAGLAVALAAPIAFAFGIPAALKSKKVSTELVPAFKPNDTGSGTGDDENDDPAFTDAASPRSACTFIKGKAKIQVGKEASIQMKGVVCSGTPYTGQLCAHTKILATVMDEEIDKNGNATPVACVTAGAGDIAGQANFVTGNIGLITCTAGTCKGTLPVVTSDPCPGVDKVAEVRRIEVFDGPAFRSAVILGTSLSVCCGPTQTTVGNFSVSAQPPCNTPPGSLQDVMAEAGTVTQGVAP